MNIRKLLTIVSMCSLLVLPACVSVSVSADDGFSYLSTDDEGLLVIKSHFLAKQSALWYSPVNMDKKEFLAKAEKSSLLYEFPIEEDRYDFRAIKLAPGYYALTAMIGLHETYSSTFPYEYSATRKHYCNSRDALVFEVTAGQISVLDYGKKYLDSQDALNVFIEKAKKYTGIKAPISEARKIATIEYLSEKDWPCTATTSKFKVNFEF